MKKLNNNILKKITVLMSILIITLSCEKKINCINCNGKGETWSDYGYKECQLCNGSGKTTKSEEDKYFR
jgi:DnaJ-class molecular chaperone